MLDRAHLLARHQLPTLLAEYAGQLGGSDAMVYLADLQQDVLVPFVGRTGPG